MALICSESPDTGKKIVGSHPKTCNSNNDCVLIDGSFSECKCGLSQNGFSYCEISEGDDEALLVHNTACAKDVNKFVWYLMRQEFFVYLQDRPICAGFVFEDLAAIDYLYSGGSLNQSLTLYSSASFFIMTITLYII